MPMIDIFSGFIILDQGNRVAVIYADMVGSLHKYTKQKPSASTKVYHNCGSRGLLMLSKPVPGFVYRAFTFTISFPCGSTMWMAQAKHGSKEWTVLSTSRGLSGFTTGLPMSAAS